ncbi:hypothetical protein N136_01980 [Leifsonia aquatica ATCC 14665]|uniref:Uncharacterized protein n=1 Tax=Leifsonia aquatica ATCC 14665 TaxID=1358026 RepID=U2TAB6_LEIAQ|nr:hypothetical protein N136_01980 [Leifsonia aquatica ATCC 14665]
MRAMAMPPSPSSRRTTAAMPGPAAGRANASSTAIIPVNSDAASPESRIAGMCVTRRRSRSAASRSPLVTATATRAAMIGRVIGDPLIGRTCAPRVTTMTARPGTMRAAARQRSQTGTGRDRSVSTTAERATLADVGSAVHAVRSTRTRPTVTRNGAAAEPRKAIQSALPIRREPVATKAASTPAVTATQSAAVTSSPVSRTRADTSTTIA